MINVLRSSDRWTNEQLRANDRRLVELSPNNWAKVAFRMTRRILGSKVRSDGGASSSSRVLGTMTAVRIVLTSYGHW